MADLDPLIRFKKHELDEKQRRLADLFRHVEALEERRKNLLDQVEHEKEVAQEMGSVEALSLFTSFTHKVRLNLEKIKEEKEATETRIELAQNDMNEAFGDLKKVEITQRRRIEEIEKENKRKEDEFFADVALTGYRRRLEEEGE